MTPENDRGIETLGRDECLALLRRANVGRLAVVVDEGQPDIFPVNYVLDGDRIVFRSLEGTKLTHASLDRVAFEADEVVEGSETAWSVVVKGVAREITNALDPESERERALLVATPMPGAHVVRIVPHDITGRRVPLRH